MSVFKRKGSPYYRYDFHFDGRRFQGSTKLTNRKAAGQAESILRARLAQSRAGIVQRKPVPVFWGFAQEFLERAKAELRVKSSLRYQVSLRSLKPWFGVKRLDEITADEIERYKQSRLEQGRSPSTVNRDLACLRRILLFAVKLDLIGTTPFVAHKVRFLKEHGRERILSFEEERHYLAAASLLLRDVATLILEMGLRPSEACSIRQQDVHLYAISPFLHVSNGKTKNAVRDVPLTERAKEVLKHRLAEAEGECIFPFRVGRSLDWSRPMCELHPAHYEALQQSGIRPPFQIYDLRHTYGTRAAEAGMDSLTLARLLGHADLKTTSRYVHLSKRHLAEAQAKIERYRAEREIAEAQAQTNATAAVQ